MKDRFYDSVEFIDDYRLLVALGSSKDDLLCVALMNTKKDTGGVPAQTSFQFPPYLYYPGYPPLLLERGVHKPSSAERLAPFHQDPTQRITALAVPFSPEYLLFSVESLVRLSEGREGCEIGWDEWKEYTAMPSIRQSHLVGAWVSGCRFFCITSPGHGPDARMEVYNFNKKGRMEYLSEEFHPDLDGVRFLSSAGANAQLPWNVEESIDIFMNFGHENVIFFRVSLLYSSLATRLNDASHVAGQTPKDDPEAEEPVLHIWTF
jgi:hypothetical protein